MENLIYSALAAGLAVVWATMTFFYAKGRYWRGYRTGYAARVWQEGLGNPPAMANRPPCPRCEDFAGHCYDCGREIPGEPQSWALTVFGLQCAACYMAQTDSIEAATR